MAESEYDQATGLRRLFARDSRQVLSVRNAANRGAAAVTLDLAAAVVGLGHRPLIIDLEKAQTAIILGLKPRYELAHVLCGDKTMNEVLLTSPAGVCVLPATRGFARAVAQGNWQQTLSGLLRDVAPFNVWLINGGVGASTESENPLLVIAPTREAITGAYAQIKALALEHNQREFRVVVDHASSESVALSVYKSIAETAQRFLAARLDYCGYLPADERAAPAKHSRQRPKTAEAPSPRAHAFARLAEGIFTAMPANASSTALHVGQ